LDEHQILGIDSEGDVPNCAVTSYRALTQQSEEDRVLRLDLLNFIAPLQESATPVTFAPDQPAAAKP
jgi:hypothetical protein